MEIIIAGHSKNDVEVFRELLATLDFRVIAVDHPDIFKTSLSPHTSVIIIVDDFAKNLFSNFDHQLICNIPVLILGKNDEKLPEIMDQLPSIDFLNRDAPITQFLYKVHFLLYHKELLNTICSLSQQIEESRKSLRENLIFLDEISQRDGLTGLYNRNHFAKILSEQFTLASARNTDLCLMLINVDYLSQINKQNGNVVGDFILNTLSARLTENKGDHDFCFRFSGEDFALIVPETSLQQGYELAEKLRVKCTEAPFCYGKIEKKITISIGISSTLSCDVMNQDNLVAMAEMALFIAKSEGRNRVRVFESIAGGQKATQHSFNSFKNDINKILNKTKNSTISSLHNLASEITGEDNRHHIHQVSQCVKLLCESLRLPEKIVATFQNAITLHASIRCLLYDEITSKPSSLTKEDRDALNKLPYNLMELIELFDYFGNEKTVLLSYGEKYDGTGLPHGLKGSSIPLGARIFNLALSFTAMNSDRPFRKRLDGEQIVNELTEEAGKQFDPFLVSKILEIIYTHKLLPVSGQFIKKSKEKLKESFPDIIYE